MLVTGSTSVLQMAVGLSGKNSVIEMDVWVK